MTDKQNEVVSNNKLGWMVVWAIIWSAVGFFINPLCIFSLGAAGFAIVGITEAINRRSKTWSIIALGLAVVETIYWLATITFLF